MLIVRGSIKKGNNSMMILPQAPLVSVQPYGNKTSIHVVGPVSPRISCIYVYKSNVIDESDQGTVECCYSSEHDQDHCAIYRNRWNLSGSWNAGIHFRIHEYYKRRGKDNLTTPRLRKSGRKDNALIEIGHESVFNIKRTKFGGENSDTARTSWNKKSSRETSP